MTGPEKTTLEIFDFDWTLFRSPFPTGRGGLHRHSWWNEEASLLPPHVPLRPGSSFWIGEVVDEMKASQRRGASLTALITGRRERVADRVTRLLEQKSIRPEVFGHRRLHHLVDKDVVFFKRSLIIKILDTHPTISRVVLWEDNEEQIKNIKELTKYRRVEFAGHLVTEPKNLFTKA